MTVDLRVRRIDPETGRALVEAPDGFVVKLPELPEGVTVGDTRRSLHQAELLGNWESIRRTGEYRRIEPLA